MAGHPGARPRSTSSSGCTESAERPMHGVCGAPKPTSTSSQMWLYQRWVLHPSLLKDLKMRPPLLEWTLNPGSSVLTKEDKTQRREKTGQRREPRPRARFPLL